MYDRLLFPTDGGDVAASAFEYALDIAAEHGATVHVLTVADTNRDSLTRIGGDIVDVLVEDGERIVAETAERASDRGVPVVTEVLQGDPSLSIVDYSREFDIDLVVIPTQGRTGLERFLLGSVTERVIRDADVPVLTVTPDAALTYPPRDVLVPTDGSRGANLALAEGIEIASATGATLHLLSVVETDSLGFDVRSTVAKDQLDAVANETLREAVETAEARSVGSVTSSIAYGRAYREILSYARTHEIDLLTMGTHGRTDFSRYVLGGVSSKIVRTSPVPVLMCRESDSSV